MRSCPVCQTRDIAPIIDIPNMPIYCNVLWSTRIEARQAQRGDIQLGYCSTCGHIFNLTFQASLMTYTQAYENSLHFSPRFQQYATALAQQLVETYQLYDKDIIGIGSGRGDFLHMLCELGHNRGVGFDPSYTPHASTPQTAVTFVQDYYSAKYAHYQADFVSCRHVLEHIEHPIPFIQAVHQAIAERQQTVVFFEVPNVRFTIEKHAIWDIIYEHCSYYSPHSLTALFSQQQFAVETIKETFNGQFLTIEARPSSQATTPLSRGTLTAMTKAVGRFAYTYHQKVATWQQKLHQFTQNNDKVVIWGAGSKGVSFLNTLKTAEQITYAIDINPHKHSMYVSGTGQEIVPPAFLRHYQPDVVLMMNANYEQEISHELQAMDLTPELIAV